jgi:hypothetical protein
MKLKLSRPFAAAALVALAAAGTAAQARDNVLFSVGVQAAPGVTLGVTNAHPVVVAPAAVIVQQPVLVAPRTVVVAPAPAVVVRPAPIIYEEGYVVRPGHRHGHGHGHGHGHDKHHRHHD